MELDLLIIFICMFIMLILLIYMLIMDFIDYKRNQKFHYEILKDCKELENSLKKMKQRYEYIEKLKNIKSVIEEFYIAKH